MFDTVKHYGKIQRLEGMIALLQRSEIDKILKIINIDTELNGSWYWSEIGTRIEITK